MLTRTTLDVDDNVFAAAREIAARRRIPVGKVLSELARQALARPAAGKERNGIPLFPIQPGAGIVTAESVRELEEESARPLRCWT